MPRATRHSVYGALGIAAVPDFKARHGLRDLRSDIFLAFRYPAVGLTVQAEVV